MWKKSNLRSRATTLGALAVLLGGYMIVADTAKQERAAEIYIKWGNAKLKLDDYHGAIADYSRIIELNPALGRR